MWLKIKKIEYLENGKHHLRLFLEEVTFTCASYLITIPL